MNRKYCGDKLCLLPILPASFSEGEHGCGVMAAVRLRFLLWLLHVLGAVVSGFCVIDKHPILYHQILYHLYSTYTLLTLLRLSPVFVFVA